MPVDYGDYAIGPMFDRVVRLLGCVIGIAETDEPIIRATLALTFMGDAGESRGELSDDEIIELAMKQAARDPEELELERSQNVASNMLTAFALAACAIDAGASAAGIDRSEVLVEALRRLSSLSPTSSTWVESFRLPG